MAVDPEHAQAVFLLAREHPRPADRAGGAGTRVFG